jgi:outer membrane protein
VLQAYLNILRAQDRLDTTKAEITAVKRQLEQVQQRFDVGLVAITDVLDSQAAYDNAVVRGIQAEGDYAISFETLSTLTGRSYESLNRLDESLPIVDPNPSQEDEWVNTALENNYGVKAARAQLKAARRDKRAKQSSHLPTVDATVTQVESVTGGRNFLGADTTQSTVYGLQLSWPLYTGGLTRSRVRQANATAEQASELLLSQQLNVTRDTRNLYKSVTTDVVRVQARLKAIRSSQSALEATETGYEVGTRNIVDVLQAQQRLFGSQFDYADSRYTYLLNLMRLKQSAGTLSEADLKELNSYMSPTNPVQRVISASTIN